MQETANKEGTLASGHERLPLLNPRIHSTFTSTRYSKREAVIIQIRLIVARATFFGIERNRPHTGAKVLIYETCTDTMLQRISGRAPHPPVFRVRNKTNLLHRIRF